MGQCSNKFSWRKRYINGKSPNSVSQVTSVLGDDNDAWTTSERIPSSRVLHCVVIGTLVRSPRNSHDSLMVLDRSHLASSLV